MVSALAEPTRGDRGSHAGGPGGFTVAPDRPSTIVSGKHPPGGQFEKSKVAYEPEGGRATARLRLVATPPRPSALGYVSWRRSRAPATGASWAKTVLAAGELMQPLASATRGGSRWLMPVIAWSSSRELVKSWNPHCLPDRQTLRHRCRGVRGRAHDHVR